MLIPKKNRKEVYKYLFKEGVVYAEKDFNLPVHPDIGVNAEGKREVDVPNLQVIKLMQSMKSKEYVKELFAWRHYYWFLTDTGIDFLRTYLNLPSEIVPATLKKSARPMERGGGDRGGDRGPRRFGDRDGDRPPRRFGDGPPGGDRDGYRGGRGGFGRGGGAPGGDKTGAPGGYNPEFRGGGFGRGGGAPRQ